jgi:hypothetical protein
MGVGTRAVGGNAAEMTYRGKITVILAADG